LSSAILYLAIVAIWACVLVPRWLHRSHDNHTEQADVYEPEEFAEQAEYSEYAEFAEYAEGAEGADPDQLVVEGEPGAGVDPVAWEDPGAAPAASGPVASGPVASGPVEAEETTVHAGYSVVSYSMTTLSVESVGADDLGGTADLDGGAGEGGAYVTASAETDYVAEYESAAESGPVPQDWSGGEDSSPAEDWSAVHNGPGRQRPHGPSRPPGRGPSRAHVLQARRRLLTMLVALTIGTALCTVTGLMPWWVLIVPIGLVGLYLMLLREVALADAEQACRRAEAHARHVQAVRARAMREQAAREAAALAAAQQTAQVINLTALAAQYKKDQPYDQYTDAEIRAVGD